MNNSSEFEGMGTRIAGIRKSHKVTQEKLAELLDVTPKHISHVENSTSSFSLKQLVKFCDQFDCSLDYIVFGKSYNSALSILPTKIVEILENGDADAKRRLIRYLETFIDITEGL